MNKSALRSLAYDILCVISFVVLGTRNHNEDTGLSGVLFVAAPFLIAVIGSRAYARLNKKGVDSVTDGVTVVLFTVAIGMILRRFVFDRGIAPAFVIVSLLYLGGTMTGWRELVKRKAH